ncbi:MAG: type II toxin-antitoxin system HipA family toxin [Rudaea sp.]|uniref:type II toxin-antitoxin system HipA family toxin n=1 Tax=Rudaea sp. TaxID=2136325 RepID=UPI0039E458CB
MNRLRVLTPQGVSGALAAEPGERYFFSYDGEAQPAVEVSLTMPVRAEPYSSPHLLPIFQMNLPEGYVLEQIRNRFAKASRLDSMTLLAMTGGDQPIGRLRFSAAAGLAAAVGAPTVGAGGERLDDILAWDGAEDLFALLADRYLLRSAISGVQPKLLVPERTAESGKASVVTADLIVKSGGNDYPGLAVNEFVCMTVAREAGLPTPDFYLSSNRELFVVRRFDRVAGAALGFEDFAVLMGKGASQKYEGSYEQLVRASDLFVSAENRADAKRQLFDQIALSCLLGNGDAHLKNFGVLYSDPSHDDVRLAPIYDLVNTTAYIPEDALALTLGGSKSLHASLVHLQEFAERCGVEEPRERLRGFVDVAVRVMREHEDLLSMAPDVGKALDRSLERFDRGLPKVDNDLVRG